MRKEYDLVEVIGIMKASHVLKVKLGGLEIELSPSAFAPDAPPEAEKKALPAIPENFTLWSVQDQSPIVQYEVTAPEASDVAAS